METDWIKSAIMEELSGTGLRPQIESETKDEVEYLVMTISLPLEWRVINTVRADDAAYGELLDIAAKVKEFAAVAWPDRMASDYQYDMFKKLPGFFDFLSEQTPEIAYRLVMARVVNAIGKRNVKGIDLYEDLLLVNTRRGTWRIDYDNLRSRLDEAIVQMKGWMRRPIRQKYLNDKRNNKHSDDDKRQD